MSKKSHVKPYRTFGFKIYRGIIKLFMHKPKFILEEEIEDGSIIILNHEGSHCPLLLESYLKPKVRFWGTYEMTEGIKSSYKYLSTTYFHNKKHMNKFWAKVVAFIACLFTNAFYKGINLIPTYPDVRLIKTIRESEKAIKDNYKIVIFPEDSSTGYHKELTRFLPGFSFIIDRCNMKQKLKVYIGYYIKEAHTFKFDKGIPFDEYKEKYKTLDEINANMCNRCNQIGKEFRETYKRK